MIIKTAIIDDSFSDLNNIRDALTSAEADYCFDISLFDSYSSCKAGGHYDLFILDIDIPHENGFDIARDIQFNNPSAIIMFCSRHNELVFDALRLNSLFFIRKSKLHEDMQDAIRKLHFFFQQAYYSLTFNRTIEKIPVNEIMYAESVKNSIIIFTTDSKRHIERKSMKQLIPDLPMKSFLRISAGCIVNIRYILEVRDTRVIMKDGKYFSVPANRIQQVKKEFGLKKVRYGMV